jgi:hypothetical protein
MHLEGDAFEIYVQICLKKSRRFTHYFHSVQPKSASETPDFGETDFLAFDPKELSLTLITCKSSPPSLEHLESVLARKEKFGGRFTKGLLCVMGADQPQKDKLKMQTRLLGLELAVGKEEIISVLQCPSDADIPPEKVASSH